MDSERRRLPGIVRRGPVAAAARQGGHYRTPGQQDDGPAYRAASVARLRAATMQGPTSRGVKNGFDARLRRAWNSVVPPVWDHLRHKWTDALLALGFLAVILLSAYVLLKG